MVYTEAYQQLADLLGMSLTGVLILISALAVWSLIWKGIALWKACKKSHFFWFILIMVVNTFGILEIIYLIGLKIMSRDDHKNRIANIEIRNISEYLQSVGKNPEILRNLDSAKIGIIQVRGGFLIQILLAGLNRTEQIPYTIPTEEKILISA